MFKHQDSRCLGGIRWLQARGISIRKVVAPIFSEIVVFVAGVEQYWYNKLGRRAPNEQHRHEDDGWY